MKWNMQAKISYLFALFCLLHLLKNAKAGNIELIEQCFENENDIEYGFCEGITEEQLQRVDIECTVRRFYFATAVFALFLCEILIKFYTQWQF